jgi:hypothetical protein
MDRWLVELYGERIDLEEFTRWFPDGELFVIEEANGFFLVGSAFEALSNSEAVLSKAVHAIDRFTAIISLISPGLQKPTVGHVIRETSGGRRDVFAFLSASLSMRSSVRGNLESIGVTPQKPQQTQAQTLLKRAIANHRLEQVLLLWADQIRSWPRLYRLMEEIEMHLEKHVDEAGLCTTDERTRFTREHSGGFRTGRTACYGKIRSA